MLQAAELGLGTTWVGHFDPSAIRNAFSIPTNLEPICLLPVGYPSKDAKPNPNHQKEKIFPKLFSIIIFKIKIH